jgi:alpha-glucosidase
MHWTPDPGAGFTTADATPWLPFGDLHPVNIADQQDDPSSILSLTRALIRVRRASGDLRSGGYELLDSAPEVWRFRRGSGTEVVLNFSSEDVAVDGPTGTMLLTAAGRGESEVTGMLSLGPWGGAIVDSR